LIENLREAELLDCLQLLHFHMGSQIANLDHFERGLKEALVIFRELSQQEVNLKWIDVGGGLAVDYQGTGTTSYFSMNYGLTDYADVIIGNLQQICQQYGIKPPTVITEAGRAMTAHHSVLITEVNDTEVPPELETPVAELENSAYANSLRSILESVDQDNCIKCFDDSNDIMDQVLDAFLQDELNMQQRARAEYLFFQICRKAYVHLQDNPDMDNQVYRDLNELLADKYFCNFSIFQSTPDVWGIGQVFPIVPLQRLDEQPDRRVLLKDLTCDSDGRIDNYVDGQGIKCTLALHSVHPKEEYLIGIFLVGAYQEILGDMHNLFGDTHSVDVDLKSNGEYEIVNVERGDTVTNVLDIVHYDIDKMIASYDQQINRAGMSEELKDRIRTQFIASLRSYTYLRHDLNKIKAVSQSDTQSKTVETSMQVKQ
jgi:arginine decarboxylase